MSSPSLLVVLDCPDCAGPRSFEAPLCGEGHAACPEVACIDCGLALLLGPPPATETYEVVLARTA